MTTEEKLQHFYDVSMESAREEAQKALEEYRRALDDMFEEHKKEKEKSAELRLKLETENAKREINKALSAEQLHIKRKLSKKQQEKLEIFRKSSDYPKWLEEKIKEAQNIADSDEIQIYLSKIDENLKESIEVETGISIQLSEEPFMGGMRAVIPAKNILIDQTFLTMFESEKEEFNFDGGLLNE